MMRHILHRCRNALGRERGVVLIAVLIFIAVILPVTLLILDSVRIESLLPVNEAYTKTAGDEADKGFYDGLAAIMEDQDAYIVDATVDFSDPLWDSSVRPYRINLSPSTSSGKHEIDYLAEMWARHPENDTVFLVERSLENIDNPENPDAGPDPEEHSVPVRWQLMNVPFGMDDFGEFYDDGGDYPRILLPFEYVGEDNVDRRAPAYYIDPSEMGMLNGQHAGDPVSRFAYNDLDTFWRLPPTDPNFYEDIGRLDSIVQFVPRPASYFRNTSGDDYFTGLNDVGLPANEGDAEPRFIREDDDAVDRFVYDGLYDFNLGPNNYPSNQYPAFQPLQQAVTESLWANPFFGSTGGSADLTATLFATTNKEYKPAPGTLTRYQLGAQEGDAIPGWHMAIVSDESARFPINSLLNIIFASHNVRYDGTDPPEVRRDLFDDVNNYDAPILDDDHPNHPGYLMARDMLISLLITDKDMARLADSFDATVFNRYKFKANWIIRQMLRRRMQLDEASDFNRNGDYTDDTSVGEIFQFPEMLGNNESDTIDTPPPGEGLYDGSGRMGDGEDVWDGTWRVFTNPKELMTDFVPLADPLPAETMRLSQRDFEILNQRVTVYSMDTEHCADPDHPSVVGTDLATTQISRRDERYNIQRMWPQDDPDTYDVDESALWDYLQQMIGPQRALSILLWREGMVDLNGDGDLNDEYIEQPVSTKRYDLDNNSDDEDAEEWPISTITYRERNHPNYQDPHLPANLIDPDYLNIRSVGDLLTIPMSAIEPLVAFSEATGPADTPTLVIRDEDNNDPPSGPASLNDRVYPDFTNAGSEIAYDDGTDDVYRNNTQLTDEQPVDDGQHPSWGPGDTLIAYYEGDSIRTYDLVTSTESAVLNNADLPPDEDDTTDNPFWNNWPTNNLIGDAVFEMASPDISPDAGYNEVVFTQVSPDATGGDEFLNPDVAYNLALAALDGSHVGLVTDNALGTFDYAPDFVGGDFIVYSRTTDQYWWALSAYLELIGIDTSQMEPIPITSLWITHRTGGFQAPLTPFWDVSIGSPPSEEAFIEVDITNLAAGSVRIKMHQPMFPSFSSGSGAIAFMDVPVVFDLDTSPPHAITGIEVGAEVRNPDIYFMRFSEDDTSLPDWVDLDPLKDPGDPDTYDIFPDCGLGNIRVAEEDDTGWGYSSADPLLMPNGSLTDSPFDSSERQAIAQDLGMASLALRERLGQGTDDQNWRLKHLPAVPEHTVDVLERITDVVCFRDPVVTYDPQYQYPDPMPWPPPSIPQAPLQAYPGRVNVNTADRAVLRTVFMTMFQGPIEDIDGDGDDNGPQPRAEVGMGSDYLNIMDYGHEDDDQYHFMALMIADRYAHQVCEYRKWIYNNQGVLGVTDETVPSNLPLYENPTLYPDTSHYGNFRANPFYPLVDTDGDGGTREVPRYNPEPPFRSIASLFHVMLYDGDEFTEDWTYEGIGAFGGPDENHLPRPKDLSTGGDTGSADALTIWGPIYNADDERWVTHPSGGDLGSGVLMGFETEPDNDLTDVDNDFYRHQYFRLFSADDFRRIASLITTRTYNYRVESRGVVRVSSGARRMDITRDKVWIITTNSEANYGARLNPAWEIGLPLDTSFLAQNRGSDEYWILYFEETPQSGLAVSRTEFLPE